MSTISGSSCRPLTRWSSSMMDSTRKAERYGRLELSAAALRSLGAAPGAVVEFVNPRGAPLRAWVASGAAAGDAPAAELPPIALRMLAVDEGAEVEVRVVHTGVLPG